VSTVVVVGSQWGDEGKGKVTDFLARKSDMIVRFQGGNNAGHTVIADVGEFKLHLIPSGILYPEKLCLVGNGVVLDPVVFLKEIDDLTVRGVSTANLKISPGAHVIMPYHRKLDACSEESRGSKKIGTTGRGIGPAYADKASRTGVRIADLIDPAALAARLKPAIEEKNKLFTNIYGVEGFNYDEVYEEYKKIGLRLAGMVADISLLVSDACSQGKNILFEGAQGVMLDIDHGTYPFVTSSNPVAAAACIGTGIGPTKINRVIGVAKAYVTRVGEGPFTTELQNEIGEHLRSVGHEFGTTTGRPRRCGWLDSVISRYSVRVCGLDCLAVTKLDVLTGLDKLLICKAYECNGKIITEYSPTMLEMDQCIPVYEEMPGWHKDITSVRKYSDLPVNTRNYLERISALSGVPIALVGVGPGRDETLVLREIY